MPPTALFVGLSTLDTIYLVDKVPDSDEKVVAIAQQTAAGGPATNAAVTFAALGGRATLASALGTHPIAGLVKAEMVSSGVHLMDLAPDSTAALAVSAVIVTRSSGERAVVSSNAQHVPASVEAFPRHLPIGTQAVLVDGHQMAVCLEAARLAKERAVQVIFDGGSWKLGTDELLPYVDIAICSERFCPPGLASGAPTDVLRYVLERGPRQVAISRGPRAILVADSRGTGEIVIPPRPVLSTTGAGDVLHGAFVYYSLVGLPFSEALEQASRVASESCMYLAPRLPLTN